MNSSGSPLDSTTEAPGLPSPVRVWGLDLTPVTLAQALELIEGWIRQVMPRFLVTANVHYAMLCERDASLQSINREAAMVVADGMPLVWASRGRLPERVAGSDLVPALCARAAERGWRVFFLGAGPGTADAAAEVLRSRNPGLQIVGAVSPPFRDLTEAEVADLAYQVQAARTDLLVLSLAMPKGERFMAARYRQFGAPVTIQAGAALDFIAGRVQRAPQWMQRCGLEWVWRFGREPRRLAGRYARNLMFVARKSIVGLFRGHE